MMEEPLVPQERAKSETSSHIVVALLQFTMAVKHRKNVLILCVFIALALGAFYYSTATRLYSARAELLILASGDETRSTGISGQGREGKNLMPTFERVIVSSGVIEDAIERLRDEDRVDLAEVPKSKWVAAINKNLSAKSIYGTNNIEIEYLSRDAAAAVAVVNQVVESYLEFMQSIHRRTADDLIHQLNEQQMELSEELAKLQLLLSRQKRDCGDYLNTDPDNKTVHPMLEKVFTIQKERWENEKKLYEVRGKLDGLVQAVAKGEDPKSHMMVVEEAVGREMLMSFLGLNAQDKASLADIERQRVKDSGDLEALLFHLGEGHPAVQALRSRIRAADEELARSAINNRQRTNALGDAALAQTLISLMQQQVDALVRLEQELDQAEAKARDEAAGIVGQLTAIQETERQIEWCTNHRELLLNKVASVSGYQDGPIIRAEVVSEPVQATSPASPNLRRVAMLALLAGLAVGLASVYVLDTLDDRFRSVEELQAQVGVPVMAIVQDLPRHRGVGVESLQLVAEPDAPESEAFRTLRTSLALTHDQSRRIVVTSAEPGDGKSTVLANMAVAYANSGKRTLLIDADLRRPGLSTMLGIRGAEGVSAVMRAPQAVGEIVDRHVRKTGVPGLDILPAGPRPMNPAELLGSQRFADMLAWAEGRYDRVLIDSPPTLAASDTAVIGQLVDGVLMVVQPHKNQRRLVLRVAETFSMLKIPLIGLVANRVGAAGSSDYYGYSVDYSAPVEEDPDDVCFGDEIDCPPERTKRGTTTQPRREGGIDLSQLSGPRRRGAA